MKQSRPVNDLKLTDPGQILLYAAEMHRAGDLEAARELLARAIEIHPNNPSLLNSLGNACVSLNDMDEAAEAYGKARLLVPNDTDTLLNLANLQHLKGDLVQARYFAEFVSSLEPASIEAKFRLALINLSEDNKLASLAYLDEILRQAPEFVPALLQRAVLKFEQGNSVEALTDLNNCIDLDPNQMQAVSYRADIFLKHGFAEAAVVDYETAIKCGNQTEAVYYNLGKALVQLHRYDDAKNAFHTALQKSQSSIEPIFALGTISLEEGDYKEAVDYFTKVITEKPDHLDGLNNRAIAYKGLNEYKQALEDYQKILQIDPTNVRALQNCAVTCLEIKDFHQALTVIQIAIDTDPSALEPYLIKGQIFFQKGQYEEAIDIYEKAKEINPESSIPFLQIGNLCRLTKNYEKAISSYLTAIEKGSTDPYLRSDLILTKLQTCSWENIEEELKSLNADIKSEKASISPFIYLTFSDDAAQQRIVAEKYAKEFFPQKNDIDQIEPYKNHEKIRLGYYSADFNDHATMHLMAQLFELHDRNTFELIAFSFGPQKNDKMRQRAEAAFDKFFEINELSDKAVALLSRHLEIDIAIDLKGYTTHSRPNIFAYRAAPVQINYLGFPGTMGAEYIDYIITDQTITPAGYEDFYSEKILRLPNCYQVNDQKRPNNKCITRSELGLPEDKFIFCSFNNNYKILPKILNAWAEILVSVPNSVFWILADNPLAQKNLQIEFEKRGIARDRIIFAYRATSELHMARQGCADLFLDTYPCNAHTTASDAVFSGLPVVTIAGETFASRVAASILNAVGLPDLVTKSIDEYTQKAINLATKKDECRAISNYLKTSVRLTPLFDTQSTTRELEHLFKKIKI